MFILYQGTGSDFCFEKLLLLLSYSYDDGRIVGCVRVCGNNSNHDNDTHGTLPIRARGSRFTPTEKVYNRVPLYYIIFIFIIINENNKIKITKT